MLLVKLSVSRLWFSKGLRGREPEGVIRIQIETFTTQIRSLSVCLKAVKSPSKYFITLTNAVREDSLSKD